MLLAWFSQELYTVSALDLMLRGTLLVLLGFLAFKYSRQAKLVKSQLRRQMAFSKLGSQLGGAATPKEAAGIIMDTAQALLGWHAGTLKLHDPVSGAVQSIINLDLVDGKIVEVAPPHPEKLLSPIMQQVLKEGAQLILRPEPSTGKTDDKLVVFGDTQRRSASLMFVPIRKAGTPVGMLSVQSYDRNAYNHQDLDVLQNLADHCAGALERIRAQDLLQAAHNELEVRVEERTCELERTNQLLCLEIEKHKKTEAALAKEQHFLHSFLETVPDSIYFKNREGRFLLGNKEKLKRLGLRNPADLVNKTDADFFAAESAGTMQADEMEILRTGIPLIGKEERVIWSDGSVHWLLTTKMPLRDEAGEIIGTFGISRDITRQKSNEEELVRSQKLLETIMVHVPDYIYFKDKEGRFTHVNRAFANQFGNCEPEGLYGKTDFDFLGEQASRESYEDEQRIMATGQPLIGKEEHEVWRDGREWWVLTSKMPFHNEHGELAGICGITRDITQRKQAEAALQMAHANLEKRVRERTSELSEANERLLAEIVERKQAELRSASFSNLGFWLGQARTREDAAQIILEVADQLLGWEAAYLQLYTPDHQRVLPVLAADVVDGKRVTTGNYLKDAVLTARDKKIISEGAELILRTEAELDSVQFTQFGDRSRPSKSLMYVPIRNGARVVGAMSIQTYLINAYTGKDLEILQALADFCAGTLERIQAEEALRKSEDRFLKAFLSSPVPMTLSTLEEGRYLDVNDTLLQLMGFTREEMLGKTSIDLGIWPTAADRSRMKEAVMKNRSVRDLECDMCTRSGQHRKILLSVEQMDFGGEPIILSTIYDVTERRNLEEKLRHSQKMEAIGQLAAGVAHDFNNILTVVQGHTTLLLQSAVLTPGHAEALRQIDMAAERAANLTRQLLAFSRKQVMQPRPLELNDVIATTSKMLHRLLGENISLHFNYSPTLPLTLADQGMVEQVLMNLAVNARDAMTNGGKLIISTDSLEIDAAHVQLYPESRLGPFVRLTVEDTGCGMDAETLVHIFEPFFTTKEVGKGTGLGLATVYGIVQQHRGWLEVSSTPGIGSIFRVYLPAMKRGATTEARALPVAPVIGGNETILVVEDEPALRDLVKEILRLFGYNILLAEHGKAALAVWETRKDDVHLLLTDMVMPEGMSGLELAHRLREDRPNLKVIYTSGYSVELFKGNSELQEGVNFVAKPYHPRILAKAIRTHLDS